MTILDVGANLGEMSLHLASLAGDRGTVHAFEPFPPAFARLTAHIARNHFQDRIHPWPIALSRAAGQLTMTVPADDADNQGIGSIINHAQSHATKTVTVEATTLDAFAHRHHLPKIDFIKLDIQGAEYFFLEGARATLERDRPEFVMEISPTDLQAINKTSRDLLELVESLGYEITTLTGPNPAKKISPAQLPPNFAATNILCIPRRFAQSGSST